MKLFSGLAAVAAIAACLGCAGAARAEAVGKAYVVSFAELLPAHAKEAADLVRAYAKASRKEPGNEGLEVYDRTDKPHQIAILETWAGETAAAGHRQGAGTSAFRDKLQPLLGAPYDERPHTGLSVAAAKPAPAGAIFVLTHVDIIPTEKDRGVAILRQLADASRGDPGMLRFDVLTQNSRPNHFTLVEIWRDQTALENHRATAHVRTFRSELLPLSGSLYDERLYRLAE